MKLTVQRATEGVFVGFFLLAFLILKAYSIHPTMSDDWIYAYLAKRVGEGVWPHSGFFFSHPPVHLLTLVPVMMIFDFSIGVVRAVPSLATAATGFFLWAIVRRAGGVVPALVTLVLFLSSYDVLRSSSHVTGTNLSLAYLSGGAWALLGRRWTLSGVLLALASLTALYTLPVIGGVLLFTLLRRPPRWKRVMVSFGAVFLGLQILVAIPAPGAYLQQVYLYHQHKKENPQQTRVAWTRAAAHHGVMGAALPLAAGGFIVMLGSQVGRRRDRREGEDTGGKGKRRTDRRGSKKRDRKNTDRKNTDHKNTDRKNTDRKNTDRKNTDRKNTGRDTPSKAGRGAKAPPVWRLTGSLGESEGLLFLLASVFSLCLIELLFLLRLKEVYTYYLMVPYALLSLAAGLGLAAWIRTLRASVPGIPGRGIGAAGPSLPILLVGLLVFAGGFAYIEMARPKPSDVYRTGREARYAWRPAPIPGFLNDIVRGLFWSDVRVVGENALSVRRYLWHESRGLEHVDEMVDKVRATTSTDDFLLGDSLLAPLVALSSNRRIFGDMADTNTKRFTSGVETIGRFIESIDHPELGSMILTKGRYLDSFPEFHAWRSRSFTPVGEWMESEGRVMLVRRAMSPSRKVNPPPRRARP